MASGVALSEEVKKAYNEMKLKKTCPYIIFRLSEDLKQIEIDQVGKPEDTFVQFKEHMINAAKNGEGRYAVYDLKDEEQEQQEQKKSRECGKLAFLIWISDDHCKIKLKMLYASSKMVIKGALEGCEKEVQINDEGDLTLANIKEKIIKK